MLVKSHKQRLELADWRSQVAEMYAEVRHNPIPEEAWCDFRAKRDTLFRTHPQTPLSQAQLEQFMTLPFFEYDASFRVVGRLETAVAPKTHQLDLPAEGLFRFTHFADVKFEIAKQPQSLGLYWIEGYGGGLFLPFRDLTNNQTTYGGGRYLYDGIKGADLSKNKDQFILDFNFAYNPSCAYNHQWVCPLAPPKNKLDIAISAGEQAFE